MTINNRIMMIISFILFSIWSSTSNAACNCPIEEADICNKCKCEQNPSNQMTINCKEKGLTEIPTFTASHYQFYELTLAGNQIMRVPSDKFKELRYLKRLDITGNHIISIDDKAFHGLNSTLQELYLDVNRIPIFPKQALSVLYTLRILYATGFDLSTSNMPEDALSNLDQLSVLNLKNNKIGYLSYSMLIGQENSLKELILDNNEFKNIPTTAIRSLQSLEYLSLVANIGLNSIEANAFNGSRLIRLDLSQNGLSLFDINAFNGLNLLNLSMRACQLTDSMLPAIQVGSLQDLELSQNNFANIPDSFFSDMGQLKTLNLHLCKIHSVQFETFVGLQNLEELDLSSNALTEVKVDTFSSVPNLKVLNIGSNTDIAMQLPLDVFKPIALKLEVINLQNTGFTDAQWSLLETLTKLKSLILTNNVLYNLPDMALANKNLLESLYLDNNLLNHLTQQGLYGPNSNLQILNLNQNELNIIPECAFHEFSQFDFFQLNLNNNPLHCDCQMKWLLQMLKGYPDFEFERYGIDWICASPQNLTGKKFAQELHVSDLTCNPPVIPIPCHDIGPPASIMTTLDMSTDMSYIFTFGVSHVSDESIHISWNVGNTIDLSGFRIEYWLIPNGEKEYKEYSSNTRNATIVGLGHSSDYIVCVMALGVNWPISSTICESVQTMPQPAETTTPNNDTLIIALACSLGVLVIITIIIIIVVLKRKQCHQKKQTTGDGYINNSMGVRVGGNSKRFSKPIGKLKDTTYFQNKDNIVFERKLEGFSKEEQDRIIGILSQNSASTLSIISNTSSHRYIRELPEPPINRVPGGGYLNPALSQEELDKHVYCEIPGEGDYNEIPDSFI